MTSYLTSTIGSGLGNQLFMIAAMFEIKHQVPDVILVFSSRSSGSGRRLEWKGFFADCPKIQELLTEELPKVQWDVLSTFQTSCFTYHNFVSSVRRNQRQARSTRIDNCFQNLRFLPNKDFTLELFNIKEKQQTLRQKIDFKTPGTCSLHFRLGDYKASNSRHTVLTDEYYENALKSLDQSKIEKIYIFNELQDQSQVESRVKKFDIPKSIEVFFVTKTFLNLKEDWEILILMSLCEINIIANSTFSWWGAYFNCSSQFPQVVYPHPTKTPWVKIEDMHHFNLSFPGWISIP